MGYELRAEWDSGEGIDTLNDHMARAKVCFRKNGFSAGYIYMFFLCLYDGALIKTQLEEISLYGNGHVVSSRNPTKTPRISRLMNFRNMQRNLLKN